MKLLPATLSEIFVPLISALDYLLVIGVIEGEGDVERMLELLDPRLFSSSSKHGVCIVCGCVCGVCIVCVGVCVCVVTSL